MKPVPMRQQLPCRSAVWGRWLAGLCWALLLALLPAQAQQSVPPLTGHVVDATGTLSAPQRQQMEAKLAAFEQSRGAQIVILLVPSTQPEDIASYSNRVANEWKIGRREVGDGLLLVVASNDHKVRIEVAKTLEGAIPDLAAKRIIDDAITPRFRQGDFAGGLTAAADQIMARISGEALPAPRAASKGSAAGFQWTDLAVFMFIAVPVLATIARRVLGTKLGALATGAVVGVLALLLTASLLLASLAAVGALLYSLFSGLLPASGPGIGSGWGGGGWHSGSGGGAGSFSSGGGGDFGGGGASGDW